MFFSTCAIPGRSKTEGQLQSSFCSWQGFSVLLEDTFAGQMVANFGLKGQLEDEESGSSASISDMVRRTLLYRAFCQESLQEFSTIIERI